jgi:hypothetical protein
MAEQLRESIYHRCNTFVALSSTQNTPCNSRWGNLPMDWHVGEAGEVWLSWEPADSLATCEDSDEVLHELYSIAQIGAGICDTKSTSHGSS